MTARADWLAGLARDYRDASLDAQADYEPADTYEPEDDDAATPWPPTAETGLHLVRPRSAHGSVPGTCGDEDVAGAAGATGGRHDRLPVSSWVCACDGCWACSGHVTGCTCDVDWDTVREEARP